MGNCFSIINTNKRKEQKLLDKLYPKHIKKYLLSKKKIDYKETLDIHNNVIVLFSDICGFTQISRASNVEEIARFLHSIYIRFDQVLDKYPLLQKIETIGDCVMIVSGLYTDELTSEHHNSMYLFAIEINAIISRLKYKNTNLNLRTGISVGPVASGIVGNKVPRYCLFGHAINFASRLQSSSLIGQIHISKEYKEQLSLININFNEQNSELKGLDIIKTYYASNIESDDGDNSDTNKSKTSCTEILRL